MMSNTAHKYWTFFSAFMVYRCEPPQPARIAVMMYPTIWSTFLIVSFIVLENLD